MLAILLGRSYQDLRLNPQDVSAFYLSQIYQVSAGVDGTSTPVPFKVPDPSAFSPTPSSVRASTLWSLSLVISLTCTVIATLLRQWARRYLRITQEPRGARNRARIRELVTQGVEMEQLQRISYILPGLFHLSVFLFLSGLVHSSNNSTVNFVILLIACICVGLYCFASVISLSPLAKISSTPLSSFAWFSWSRIVWFTYKLLFNASIRLPFIGNHTRHQLWELAHVHLSSTLRDTVVNIKDLARKRSSSLDPLVVSRAFDSLDGHEDMEQFLSAIPGFYKSGEVNKDSLGLEGWNDKILAPAIVLFMGRSLSSNLLTKHKEQQRIIICLQAMKADPFLLQCTFRRTLQDLNSDIFRCVDFVSLALEYLRGENSNPWVKDFTQCIVAVAINRMHVKDDAWINIAEQYTRPEHALYLREGHNLRLCNLIYLIRQLKVSRLESSDQFKQGGIWRNVLAEALKFDITNTGYELQLEFCSLLDELRSMVSGWEQPPVTARSNARLVLSYIRTAFIPLHEGTVASPTGYPDPVLQWLASFTLNDHWAEQDDPEARLAQTVPESRPEVCLTSAPPGPLLLDPIGETILNFPPSPSSIVPNPEVGTKLSPVPVAARNSPPPSHHPEDITPPDGFIPLADNESTIRLPPPHEMVPPVAPPSPISHANTEPLTAYNPRVRPAMAPFEPESPDSTTISQFELVSEPSGSIMRPSRKNRPRLSVIPDSASSHNTPEDRDNTAPLIAPNPGVRPDIVPFEPDSPDSTTISQFELVSAPSGSIARPSRRDRPSLSIIPESVSSHNTPVDRANTEPLIAPNPGVRPDIVPFEPESPGSTSISQFELVSAPSGSITRPSRRDRTSLGIIPESVSSHNTSAGRSRSISVDRASRPHSSASVPYGQVFLPCLPFVACHY